MGGNITAFLAQHSSSMGGNLLRMARVVKREIGTELRNPDFAKFAESFGADGVKLARVEDLEQALPEAIANNRPTVIEVPMDRLPSPF